MAINRDFPAANKLHDLLMSDDESYTSIDHEKNSSIVLVNNDYNQVMCDEAFDMPVCDFDELSMKSEMDMHKKVN